MIDYNSYKKDGFVAKRAYLGSDIITASIKAKNTPWGVFLYNVIPFFGITKENHAIVVCTSKSLSNFWGAYHMRVDIYSCGDILRFKKETVAVVALDPVR